MVNTLRGSKPLAMGQDFAKHGSKNSVYRSNKDGRADANDAPPESAPLITMADIMQEVRLHCADWGYELKAQPGGDVAGFNVYSSVKPDSKLGLAVPKDFAYKKRIRPTDHEFGGFRSCIEALVNTIRADCPNEAKRKVYTLIGKAILDRPKDGRTDLYQYSLALNDTPAVRSLNGGIGNVHKYVPKTDWFKPAVQQLTANDLLGSLLPEAEMRMFMLCLGRVLAGKGGSRLVEGYMPELPFASYCVLVGFDGGEGKSSLLDGFLKPTLGLMGYATATIDPDANRFGKMWVTADYAMSEDINDKGHKALLVENPLVKSVVSGASTVFVEEKGVQGREVEPTALPFYCANNFNNEWLFGADAGMLRRYNALRCYSSRELQVRYGDGWKEQRLRERWMGLAESLDVTVFSLAAWLCRLSLDYYMTTAGVVLDTEGEVIEWNWRNCRLEDETKALRQLMVIDVSMEHTKRLMDSLELVTLCAVKVTEPRYQKQLIEQLSDIPLTAMALHKTIEIWRQEEQLPESLQPLYLQDICPTSRASWDSQADTLHNDISVAKNPSKVWERLIECILVKDKGWKFRTGLSHYTSLWSLRKATFSEALQNLTQEDVEGLPELTYQYVKELSNHLLEVMNIVKKPKRRG